MSEVAQILINSAGAVSVTVAFLWYLRIKNTDDREDRKELVGVLQTNNDLKMKLVEALTKQNDSFIMHMQSLSKVLELATENNNNIKDIKNSLDLR